MGLRVGAGVGFSVGSSTGARDGAGVAHTEKSSQKALRLADACVTLATAEPAPPDGGRQPAWQIARRIACNTLDFDARVLPCELVLPYARTLDSKLWEVVAKRLRKRVRRGDGEVARSAVSREAPID